MKPYTYFITFTHPETKEQKFYYGVQYGINASPDNLWKTYFTSSSYVKSLREQHSDDCFSFEVRKTFDCPLKAQKWEQKVIRRMNIIYDDKWLNLANGGVYNNRDPEVRAKISASKKGKARSPETIEKMRIAATGRIHSEESRKKVGIASLGRKHSLETREKQSRVQSEIAYWRGKKRPLEACKKASETMKGRIFSEEHKQKISLGLKNSTYQRQGHSHVRVTDGIQIFDSIKECAKYYDIDPAGIMYRLKSESKKFANWKRL